ncbi:MAG: hypothetical protein KAR05_08555 [Candidatus Omnitrophica bacterium]|nr:hypothetical protein [Candidatus Omnitrophota bacterium]
MNTAQAIYEWNWLLGAGFLIRKNCQPSSGAAGGSGMDHPVIAPKADSPQAKTG